MRLKSVSYKENFNNSSQNPWELEELTLGEHNLIVGRNATGKSRIVGIIHHLAGLIQSSIAVQNGEWSTCFIDDNQEIQFCIGYQEGKIVKEKIVINGVERLDRDPSTAKIYSQVTQQNQIISPPNDRMVLHVRRDKNEFPFLESLVSWANSVKGFAFANTSPNLVEIPGHPYRLTSLNAVPTVLENLDEVQRKKILKQLEFLGYNVENASTSLVEGLHPIFKMILLKERGIAFPLKQSQISQGMFRAFSLLAIIEFLRSQGKIMTILIDDFGEGLDFDRSRKLAEIIFDKTINPKIHLIATSNDSFLMNSVLLAELTICYRDLYTVKCLNYSNSKDKFEEWKQLGLNNFDLFSSDYLLS